MYMRESLVFASGGRSNFRIPSIVAATDGSVFAFCNDRKDTLKDHAEETALVCSRRKPGGEWEPARELAFVPQWACSMGAAVYDTETNVVMCSGRYIPVTRNEFGKYTQEQLDAIEAETNARVKAAGLWNGPFLISSADGGETWQTSPHIIEGRPFTRDDGTVVQLDGSCHGSAHGIRLRHGEHAGRLLCPSRTQTGFYNTWEALRECGCNNAIYSDDHGRTWKASAPVQFATGEGTLIERPDGSILYNSRAYVLDGKRYLADSTDGGETYGSFRADDFLFEELRIGCNASFLRVEREDIADTSLLPENADGITVFANPRAGTRENMTCCVSFDSGATWSHTRAVWPGPCAYSSLDFSAAGQRFFLMYEKGDSSPYDSGIAVAEFDIEWLLGSD